MSKNREVPGVRLQENEEDRGCLPTQPRQERGLVGGLVDEGGRQAHSRTDGAWLPVIWTKWCWDE